MNKFFRFEKESVVKFMAERADVDIEKFLDEKEVVAIERDLKYGTFEYLADSIQFKPTKADATVIELNLFLGNDTPKQLLKGLLTQIRTPYTIFVDFWCIAESITSGLLVIYPSYGTS